MKTIKRYNSFETNSSSSHSLVIKNTAICPDIKLEPKTGKYGLKYQILSTPEEKLSYLLTAYICCTDEDINAAIKIINNKLGKKVINRMFETTEEIIKAHENAYINFDAYDFARGIIDYPNYIDLLFNDDIMIIVKGDCNDNPENTRTIFERD